MRSLFKYAPLVALAAILIAPVWSQAAFTEIELRWTASTTAGVSYNVYRSTTSGSSYSKVNTSPVNALLFDDTGAVPGQKYFYAVTAVDSTGNESALSNEVNATLPLAPAPPTALTAVPK